MNSQPDYPGLVDLLLTTRSLVDAGGTVILEPHEAESIRALGFQAQPGKWCVPPLPAHLVAGNPLLEALGDDRDPFWCARQSASEPGYQAAGIVEQPVEPVGQVGNPAIQNTPMEVTPPEASEKDCAAILAALERAGGSIERRKLQKKLWRVQAEQFNQAIQSLVERGLIHIEGNMLTAPHANGIQPPGVTMFHGVTPTNDEVPQGDPAVGLPGAADSVNEFRGSPYAQRRKEGD